MSELGNVARSLIKPVRSWACWSKMLLLILILPISHVIQAQPFYCTGELILASSPDGDSSRFYHVRAGQVGSGGVVFQEFSTTPEIYLNAMGHSSRDGYVYAIAPNSRELCRLDVGGEVEVLAKIEELDASKSYNAGAVTLDGKYLIALSARAGTPPFNNLEIVRIHLEPPDYSVEVIPLSTMSDDVVSMRDVAFHPTTGIMYGYDGIEGRLVSISLSSYEVDDVSYPETGDIELMAALFFDAWGNLYGYGRERGQVGISSFYRIDVGTGATQYIGSGPLASGSDGCSCPTRIEFTKSVQPEITVACSQVVYKFVVVNATGSTQNGVQFVDKLPPGFKGIEMLDNPYNGNVSGLNTDRVELKGMQIPPGIDSFEILVEIGDVPPGIYKNQAALLGLPLNLGGMSLSDDPVTFALNDSTALEVDAVGTSPLSDSLLIICPDDTLTLDASYLPGSYAFLWSTGEVGAAIQITDPGMYDVIATNDCQTLQVIFMVQASSQDFTLDLGPDQTITLGDIIEIEPDLAGLVDPLLNWHESSGADLDCPDCPVQILTPLNDATYYLAAADVNGCMFLDSITVFVEKNYTALVPNVFSPNHDGTNDILHLFTNSAAMVEAFEVYDRWGNTVFTSADHPAGDLSVGWDGTSGGRLVQPGVYVWSARVQYLDGEVRQYVGDVTVVR